MAKKKIEDTREGLENLTRDELTEAIDDGYAVLEELSAEGTTPSDDDLKVAQSIRDLLDKAEARASEIDGEAQAREDQLAEIRAKVEARKAEKAEADEPKEVEQPETDKVVEEPVVEEPVEVEVVETVAPEAIAASAATARERLAGRKSTPAPVVEGVVVEQPKVLIAAAADAGVYPTGQKLDDLAQVVEIAQHRFKTMAGAGGRVSLGVATFNVPAPAEFTLTEDMTSQAMQTAIDKVADESRLDKPLTAAGWCAPSETIYDLCPGSTTEGLYDLPEIRIDRGGINYTEGPDYSELYSADNVLTEAEVIAGTDKVCLEVPCPDFDEVRLDAVYMCVTSSLLTKVGYPELVTGFLQEAMIAHQHRVSSYRLGKVVAAAGAAVVAGAHGSITAGALTAVELVAEGQRAARRWSMAQTIEVVLPHWARVAFRADLAQRTGVDFMAITDAQVDAWFAVRGLRIQYIYGWQQLPQDAVEFPATMQALVYKAGTFVAGTAPVISLNAVYDSALLKENKHIALFFEEGQLVLGRCNDAKLITIPVCTAGRTGAANIVECLTV
jgi:hypothetical protein